MLEPSAGTGMLAVMAECALGKRNWLSNRIFKTYDDIVALCCEAWNRLIDQPWKIMSIGRRKWAHGF